MSELVIKEISGKDVVIGELLGKVMFGSSDSVIVKQLELFIHGSKYLKPSTDTFVFEYKNDAWRMNTKMRFISSETPPELLSIYKTVRDADKLKLESFLDLVIQGYFVKQIA